MKKACIFDLDGTLLYTLDSLAEPTNRVLRHFDLPEQPVEAFKIFVGDGLKNEMKRALIASGDEGASLLEEAFPMVQAYFDADPLYHVRPYDGMVEALKSLKENGLKLAVLSNKPHNAAIEVVEHFFGRDCFDMIVGQSEEVPVKPDPAGCKKILKEFGYEPSQFCYFGDTNTDMMTGKKMGFTTAGVAWGYRGVEELVENGADVILYDPSQIISLIKAL